MKGYNEGLSIFLRHSAEFISDGTQKTLDKALYTVATEDDILSSYETRCFNEGFAVRLNSAEKPIRINFKVLYKMNSFAVAHKDPNFCYIHVGPLLVSVPVTNVAIADMVGYLYAQIRKIIERQFILFHMNADGTAGHECVPGQSGSRFVIQVGLETRSSISRPHAIERKRRSSLQHSGVLCLKCSMWPPSQTSSRGRQSLRESSEVHSYRHVLFRSHSLDRQVCKSHDSSRDKKLGLFFSQSSNDETVQSPGNWVVSRWVLPGASGGQHIPHSSMFVFHSPSDFDLNRLRLSTGLKSAPSAGLSDSSPQSTPNFGNLVDDRSAASNLMTVIQDLISRRGVTLDLNQPRAMSAQLDTILWGGGNLYRMREELRRQFAPLNAHLVSRAVAISELSRVMDEDLLEELLTLADQQGFKDRPLLVQLDRGQWSRLCPRDIRLAAAMVGPTETPSLQTGKLVPLPEHRHGQLAFNRLESDFSSRLLSNTVWKIRIKFEPMSGQPVRIGPSGSEGVSELSFEDCQRGFKKLNSGGVIVTKWTGLVHHSTRQVTVERHVSVLQLLEALKNSIQLKHQLKWDEINLRHEWMTDPNSLLRDHMHWCACEYLKISLQSDGIVVVQRAFDDPHVTQDGGPHATEGLDRSTFQTSGPMLWDMVEKWSSDETRNILSQYASNSVESECLSPTSRRRRVMAKIASGSAVNRTELEELGVDVHTEYTRYWTQDDHGGPDLNEEATPKTPRMKNSQRSVAAKLDLSGAATRFELVSPVMSPRQVESPKSPVSPVNRSRRQSFWKEQEPRVLRSTKDTRQFEFHPFDPNLILTGSRSGLISLVDADRDVALMQTRVDTSPILGLSWLRAHMNVALYGASSSGLVGMVKLGTTDIDYQPIGRFQNLSSVSINCTDDYFLVSGFSRDVSLFDLVSGRKVSEFKEIHSNFINITRFANFSPHLLATSSFDSTCKLWDLRKPATSCIASYTTPSLNVMCCFSPLDDNLLVSGLDANVVQLSVRKGLIPNINSEVLTASIPARNSSSNYRRAVYTADGSKFITSGTDENFMRVIDAESGASQGICKFDGLLESFEEQLKVSNGYKPLKQEPAPRTDNKTSEYVQSLRGHPIFTKEVGVLLYPFDRSRSSYVCTTKIPSN